MLLIIFLVSIMRQHKYRLMFFKLQVIRDMQLIEEERKRIALDLHDDLGSVLATVRMGLQSIGRIIPDSPVVYDTLRNLDHSVDRVKILANNLVPQTLEELGLIAAIDELLIDLDSPVLRCIFTHTGSDNDFDPKKSLVLFRVMQEIMTNVVKHSRASEANVLLTIDQQFVKLQVKDNGIGFNATDYSSLRSFGLSNIRSRLNLLSAAHTVKSSLLQGTDYQIQIPITSLL
jgi:signal transduction histidine kinase